MSERSADVTQLKAIAKQLREDIILMLTEAGSGHPGGSLSAIDIVTALYFHTMKHDPKEPMAADRDRFVLSKGHAVPAQYAAMAHGGYFPKSEWMTLRKLGSRMQGHPVNTYLPGIEAPTGSLGQGLSVAQGLALGLKLQGSSRRVFCMLGDGESQEGQVWEAAMSAPKFKLDNLVVVLDHNNGQIDGHVSEVMPLEPVLDKWRAFHWNVIDIDGHDFAQILQAFDDAAACKGKPTFIRARTVKGKGVSFMEDLIKWHGATPSKAEAEKAIAEIRAAS